ncbi:hypothetical protein [Thomasclavelia ramosa]|uniref:hypothetical protein n=1 Tax=Thomasclavelia ramosa TaxID=1547 RepID=UPI0034BC0A26
MLKIEKIKEEILNFDTDVTADEALSCWLHRITTNSSVNKHNCSALVCSECLRLSLLELLKEYKEEYKKPIKLTRFEYEYLKVAKKEGFNFIARDKNGTLVIYNIAPHKTDTLWCTASAKWGKVNFNNLFKFVKWEDAEPREIYEILANCTIVSGDEDD